MAYQTFEYSYFIDLSADQLYAYMTEPEHYARLSPIVGDMRNLRLFYNAEHQECFEYDTVEALHFAGMIPYSNPIHVTATMTIPNQQMLAAVDTRLGVRMRFVFDLIEENGGTLVRETVEAHAPRLLQSYVVAQAKAVQQARVEMLKSRLELTPA